MGIAILSGVVQSLDPALRVAQGLESVKLEKWESHTPGTQTPTASNASDTSIPSKFIACVKSDLSAQKLKVVFGQLGGLGSQIEVATEQNVHSVSQADVVLLW